MKRRFLSHLALLLLVAMLLPTPIMAESLLAAPADEVYNLEQATPPEELPEFQLAAPEAEDTHEVESVVMAAASATTAATTTKLTFGVKEKYTLSISGAKKYETSDKTIATVSKKGVIVAKKAGKATITATDKKGKQTKVKVTVKKAPAKVTLNKTKYTLTVGKALQLKAKLPSGTASNKITWISSKKSVATVDANGKVTAVKAGTAKITVKTFNGKKATCTVTVKNPAPKKVTLNESEATLTVGEALELAATLQPDNAVSKLAWTSSKENIAKVDSKGKVTALKAGKTVITVKTDNGKRAKCTITVEPIHPEEIMIVDAYEIELDEIELVVDDTYQLHTLMTPEDAEASLTWTSTNESVASVSKEGVVTGLAEGKSKISVLTDNGKKAYLFATVTDPYTAKDISITDGKSIDLKVGHEYSLETELLPETAVTELTWSSSDESIATVSSTGTVTALKEGEVTITVSTDNELEASIRVNAYREYGDVSGTVTYLYNNYRGHVADTGALVYLIPTDGSASAYVNDSYINFRGSAPYGIENHGIYAGKVDGSGNYTIQHVPEGKYKIYIISHETSAERWFNDEESYYSGIRFSLSSYLNGTTAQSMARACSYNKYRLDTINVYGGQTTKYSYDFGITYI